MHHLHAPSPRLLRMQMDRLCDIGSCKWQSDSSALHNVDDCCAAGLAYVAPDVRSQLLAMASSVGGNLEGLQVLFHSCCASPVPRNMHACMHGTSSSKPARATALSRRVVVHLLCGLLRWCDQQGWGALQRVLKADGSD
jgi:hypothetical protein